METLKLSLAVIFHPVDTFNLIKSRKIKLYYTLGFVILVLAFLARLAQIYITGYQFTRLEPKDANVLLEILRIIAPILVFVVAAFAVTSILEGESFIPEIFIAAAYCMMPYILLNVPVAILSRFMGRGEAGLYNALIYVIWIWVVVLLFLCIKTLNDYDTWKALLTSILIIFFMLLIFALCILFIALTGQLYMFFKEVIYEIRMVLIE